MIDSRVDTIKHAMRNFRGDNLQRATAAWGHLSAKQMQEQQGESGHTRQWWMDTYREADAKWIAAWDLIQQTWPDTK